MDFFDDPNLFGLEDLDENGFPTASSLVDGLNLSPDFEPLQVQPLGPEKHQGMMAPVSTHQAVPTYSPQMSHYIGIKSQNPMGQGFSCPGGKGSRSSGMIAEQHGQYHNPTISQVSQSNGLFCNRSSPMWGNQDQHGPMYHNLTQQQQSQQHCHQPQHLHNQQLHAGQQQQHHPCHLQQQEQQQQQQRMRQQLQQQQQQQLLNQHQQINPQTMSLQQQHHNFSFHQGSQSIHHSQQQVQRQLPAGGPRFHSNALPSKSYLDGQNTLSGNFLQQPQQQGSYQLTRGGQAFSGSQVEATSLPFSMHSSSMVPSLPKRSVSSAMAYHPAQYPAYPGEPEMPNLSQQSLLTASVSRSTTSTASLTPTVPELSGIVCQFPSTTVMSQPHSRIPVNQVEECPFRALRCAVETQGNCKSSDMFGDSMNCYTMPGQLPSEQPQSCGAINTNGYQALGDSFLPSEAQDGDLEGLEPPDLLPDLLPQLEAALSQEDESNCSWADSSQERGHGHKNPPPVEVKEEKVTQFLVCKCLSCPSLKW